MKIVIEKINNRVVEFLEDFPKQPARIVFGTPIYYIRVRLGGKIHQLELYHKKVVTELKSAGSLIGKRAMIQLPEQEGAEWCARVIS